MIELLRTLHLHTDEAPFVSLTPGLEIRFFHVRKGEFSVSELRASPGARTGLHRHLAPVFSLTSEGRWGHDTNYEYRPGTYVFETPGVVHQFMNGAQTTRSYFISTGDVEYLDADGAEVVGRSSIDGRIELYLNACEQAGLPRPNILV